MKSIKVTLAVILSAICLYAENTVPLPTSVTITNSSVILLPAIQPPAWTNWTSNRTFAINTYIGQFTNVVSETGKTNYNLRYWYALQGGTNQAYATYAPLSLVTDTVDAAVIWRPVPDKRGKAAIFNIGANAIFLGFNRAAVANKGWYVAPNGGSYITTSTIGEGPGIESWQGEVNGCTTGTGLTNLITVQELPR